MQGVWTYYNMIPCLRRIWDRMSTVSLSGFPGRNVAIDHLCEKVNLSSKVIIGNYPTNGRIRTWVPALNILMPCQAYYFNYMASIGHDDDDEDDDRRSQKADREATIQSFKQQRHWLHMPWVTPGTTPRTIMMTSAR